MTDNEIIQIDETIKALEQCGDENNCAECPYKNARFGYDVSCAEELMKAAAKQLKRQKAHINKLNFENLQLIKSIKYLRSEAYKEFAERAKQSAFDCEMSFGYGKEHYTKAVAVIEIDNVLAELTEHKQTVSMIDGHIEE